MPRPTDEPDTLPDPELNPLFNPLLAAHMGRWAEVYFTAPPEKRSQAVAELIQELENCSSEAVPTPVSEYKKAQRKEETVEIPKATQPTETSRICNECAYENSAAQRFCGLCGTLLVAPVSDAPRDPEARSREASWGEADPAHDGDPDLSSLDPALSTRSEDNSDNPAWRLPETPIPHFAIEPEPGSFRYRLYLGVVLVILIGLLVYRASRGTTAISRSSGPQPLPSKVMPAAPSATADVEQQPKVTPSESLVERTPPSPPGENQPEKTQQQRQAADSPPASQVVTQAAGPPSIANETSGADDLATAERYLNTGQGQARDGSEAALWLWKAVGKGNPAATMVLSDLYLRGDGVPKSCDQARLLLNAAARKGSKAAGERLRNLQAFGCK